MSQVEVILSKLEEDSLSLLAKSEHDDLYILTKLLAWQEEYYMFEWRDFKHWIYCSKCGNYDNEPCDC